MIYHDIVPEQLHTLAELYMETFNAPPWNEAWTIETASKRLHQMIFCEGAYGLAAYADGAVCGMILGGTEQFYHGIIFEIKEFCVKRTVKNQGIGTKLLKALELRLKQKGIKEIVLRTLRKEETEGFYQRRGFVSQEAFVFMGKTL